MTKDESREMKDGGRKTKNERRSGRSIPLGGTYALILFLERETTIRVGALGRCRFPGGHYVYIGSAMNGLDARIKRHLARRKKLHWHIDYVLKYARVVDVWAHRGRRRLECMWAARVLALENACVIAERLGASDCHCRTHLIYLNSRLARE